MRRTFKNGEPVVIVSGKDKWIVHVEDKIFHCKLGGFDLSNIIGKRPGDIIESSRGKRAVLYHPTKEDIIRNLSHSSQIIYEKDAALIIFLGNILPGMTVYEAGTGSGSLTAILALSVGPNGKVITHEIRKEAQETAKKNIEKLGLKNIEFVLKDVSQGFKEGIADAIILDMGDPWKAIPHASASIVPGGKIVVFVPTFNQLEKTKKSLKKNNFIDIKAFEFLEREIQIGDNATRPATRMIGHTGYLLTGKRK